ncbi:MAG TPA: hypothetical protein VFT95_17335 [Micromonosporaceae bacterium]|nr:hypothetical protein [Micromonosporaceae bacterium]
MDPLPIASGVVALTGLGVAWRMYRRASRAEAEADSLRGELRAERGGPTSLPNQRPWRLATPVRREAHPP